MADFGRCYLTLLFFPPAQAIAMVLDSIDDASDNSLEGLRELAKSYLEERGANAADTPDDTPDAGSFPHADHAKKAKKDKTAKTEKNTQKGEA